MDGSFNNDWWTKKQANKKKKERYINPVSTAVTFFCFGFFVFVFKEIWKYKKMLNVFEYVMK